MSDEKLYNIPFDGERPEPNVRHRDPTGFIDDLKLANQKLAEAQALIVELRYELAKAKALQAVENNRIVVVLKENAILIEALKFFAEPYTWSRMWADVEHADIGTGLLNNLYGSKAREALAKINK